MAAPTGAQRAALRYFARANTLSRALSDFADYHATTRGTASQTVKSLVARGYLARTPCSDDLRSARIDFTAAGEAAAETDPFTHLDRAASDLSSADQAALAAILDRLGDRIAKARDASMLGHCESCRNLERSVEGKRGDARADVCKLTGRSVDRTEPTLLCMHFASRRSGDH